MSDTDTNLEVRTIENALLMITGVHFAQWERLTYRTYTFVLHGDRSRNSENARLYLRVIKHGVSCFESISSQPGISSYLVEQWFEFLIAEIVPSGRLRAGVTQCDKVALTEISSALMRISIQLGSKQKFERVERAISPYDVRKPTTRFRPSIFSR